MPDLKVQYVAHAPNGERLGIIPFPLAARSSDVLNDLGQGTLDYLASAPRAEVLEQLCEVSVEIWNGATWIEPSARLLRLQRGSSRIDELQTRRYTLQSYGMQLAKVRMLREELLNENGERVFADATAGSYVKTLIDESKGRGNVPGLLYSFTDAADSAGVPWGANAAPRALKFGDDLLSFLRGMASEGVLDWQIVGRELRLLKPNTLGVDRSAAVSLRHGRDFTEAPDDEDGTEMAGRIGVLGDAGRTYEAISGSVGPWGLWEELVNASGVRDIGGLQLIGEVEQERRSAPRVQMTRQIQFHTAKHLPYVGYGLGDTLLAPDDRGEMVPLRVRQVTLTHGASGLAGNLVLNDRFIERDLRNQRNITGLMGAASASAGSGTGAPSTDDKTSPAVPTGFVVSTSHLYTPAGDPFALIDAGFVPVSRGVDGLSLPIARHELFARENVVGEPWKKLTEVDATTGRITYSPLPAGQTWQFKLRAASREGVLGDFTAPVTIALAADTTPPPVPSTPLVASRLGIIAVAWDGLDEDGVEMPIDFARVDVWQGPGIGTIVGSMRRSGGMGVVPIAGVAYNTPTEFWLTAVDTSQNTSARSVKVTGEALPLVNTDLIGLLIDGAQIEDGTVNAADKIIGNTIIGALIQGLAIDTGHLKANAVTADKAAVGLLEAMVVQLGQRNPLGSGVQRVPADIRDTAWWTKVLDGSTQLVAAPAIAPVANVVSTHAGLVLTPTVSAGARVFVTAKLPIPDSRKVNGRHTASGAPLSRVNYYPNPAHQNMQPSGLHAGATAYNVGTGSGAYFVSEGWQIFDATGTVTSGGRFGYYYDMPISAVAGEPISVRVLFRGLAGSIPLRLWMDAFTAADGAAGHVDAFAPPGAEGEIKGTLVASAAVTRVRVYIWVENTGAFSALGSGQIGQPIVEKAAAAGGFFYGGSPDAVWLGAANNSASSLAASGLRAVTWDAAGVATVGPLLSATRDLVLPQTAVEYAVAFDQSANGAPRTLTAATVFEVIGTAIPGASMTISPAAVAAFRADGTVGSEFTAAGVRGYKPDGSTSFAIDSATGGVEITGALVRSAAAGARTELTASGLRTLDAAGNELVKLGYGLARGLAVRNPRTGALVELASMAFGIWSDTAPNTVPQGVDTGEVPAGNRTRVVRVPVAAPFVAPSERVLVQCTYKGSTSVNNLLYVRVQFALTPGGPVVAQSMEATTLEQQLTGAFSSVVGLTAGTTYYVNYAVSGFRPGAPSTYVSIDVLQSNITLLPV